MVGRQQLARQQQLVGLVLRAVVLQPRVERAQLFDPVRLLPVVAPLVVPVRELLRLAVASAQFLAAVLPIAQRRNSMQLQKIYQPSGEGGCL